jgi:hypothetical protein
LASTGPGLDLQIDYSLSVEEVYMRVALAHLRENDLDLFHYLGDIKKRYPLDRSGNTGKSLQIPLALPSWVPDYKYKLVEILLFLIHKETNFSSFTEFPNNQIYSFTSENAQSGILLTSQLGRASRLSYGGSVLDSERVFNAATNLPPKISFNSSEPRKLV